ncbi:MAG: phosphoribosylamine--glycine ligase [Clostridia bacterium]|nr:phosphoribosylamine--glycine ligase [Clostridia bacterium]
MKILVVGGGGREHAIIKSLKKNKDVEAIYALPGNGGIASDAICVNVDAKDIDGIVNFAVESKVDYAVVAPDDPLVLGAVDALEERGIPCFGPNKAAAIIEGSKAFAKELMKKNSIPTARYETFDNLDAALKYLEAITYPTVVKADGLALGKGVIIAKDKAEAELVVKSMMSDKIFGESGSRVIIEEFLEGPEVSVLAFTDGHTVVPMISSMDHKRARDNDEGLNTGGMGTVAPNPYYTEEIQEICMKEIFIPTIEAMRAEGRTFKGCLYFGLMITKSGPKVIEYNCRFGDPETQVVLPLLKTDLLSIMQAVTEERLAELNVEFSSDSACCVIMASKGYPEKYDKGYEINIPDELSDSVYVAGARLDGERIVTSGGRVLGVVATADSLKNAVDSAYEKVGKIHFENAFFRRDIGAKALAYSDKKRG